MEALGKRSNLVEGVESKPLSVHLSVDRIQLCVLPFPKRATSMGLFGLAPMRIFVSATFEQSRLFRFIVHTQYCSFLIHCQPFLTPFLVILHYGEGTFLRVEPCQRSFHSLKFRKRNYFFNLR
jgi:hypothetical protein